MEMQENFKLNIFPNPSGGEFITEVETTTPAAILLTISDLTGNVVYSHRSQTEEEYFVHPADLSGFPTGLYLIRVETATWMESRIISIVR
jgi:hypothetical protein